MNIRAFCGYAFERHVFILKPLSSAAASAAASAIAIAAFSTLLVLANASDGKTCDYYYDSTYNYCSHTLLLSGSL